MVKELDRLLLSIEQEGGFVDASTVHLKNLVFELEKGLEKLSKRSRVCKVFAPYFFTIFVLCDVIFYPRLAFVSIYSTTFFVIFVD